MNNIVKTLPSAAVVLLIVIGALFGFAGLTDIDPGEVGLKIKMIGKDKGMQDDTLDTGMHWINPVTYDIATYDTRLKQYTLEDVASTTKDGQPVLVDLSLEIGLMDKGVPNLHETVGKNYFDQVVYPATRSAIRNNTSKQLSDGIYTGEGRALVQEGIAEFLKPKLAEKGIIVEVNLRDISFSNAQFVQTLEQKAMAQQQVLIKERNAKAAEHEADRMENIADGKKRERVKQAEAKKEELRLEGEGEKLSLRRRLPQNRFDHEAAGGGHHKGGRRTSHYRSRNSCPDRTGRRPLLRQFRHHHAADAGGPVGDRLFLRSLRGR